MIWIDKIDRMFRTDYFDRPEADCVETCVCTVVIWQEQ